MAPTQTRLLRVDPDVPHVLRVILGGHFVLRLIIADVALGAHLRTRFEQLEPDDKHGQSRCNALPRPGRQDPATLQGVLPRCHVASVAHERKQPLVELGLRAMCPKDRRDLSHAEKLGVHPPAADAAYATLDVVAEPAARYTLLPHIMDARKGQEEGPPNAAIPIVLPFIENETVEGLRVSIDILVVRASILEAVLLRGRIRPIGNVDQRVGVAWVGRQ
mmetsp:Transcript_74482/g.227882  ORF Transcript_74482/g.227882 Transcript_74482/m.227882 type:complete len:219 (+) Transcript_74482:155-811(+)